MGVLSKTKIEKLSHEVEYRYSRSSGPGGQKVNKTETRAELYWNLFDSSCFSMEQKRRISQKLKSRLNKEGFLVFYSDQHRSRLQNKKACFDHLIESLEKALIKPKPRKKTKPTRASVEKRIKEKKQQSDKKRLRQKLD